MKDGSGDPPGPGRNGERDFHGEKKSKRHACLDHGSGCAALSQRGAARKPSSASYGRANGNRSGLIVAATLTKATGTAERAAAEKMIVRHSPGARRITLGEGQRFKLLEGAPERTSAIPTGGLHGFETI